MQNKPSFKDVLFLLLGILIAGAVFINIAGDFSKTRALESQSKVEIQEDPAKDFKSLDNYITYSLPAGWKKEDQVDNLSGENTLLILTSPDYDAPETGKVDNGVRIIVDRSYDLKPEETISMKLNAQYQFYHYNILSLKVGNKNAMTMHEDYEGHNRFIYVAKGNHLWQISISAKSLEDEQKYEAEINSFLDSIEFKD